MVQWKAFCWWQILEQDRGWQVWNWCARLPGYRSDCRSQGWRTESMTEWELITALNISLWVMKSYYKALDCTTIFLILGLTCARPAQLFVHPRNFWYSCTSHSRLETDEYFAQAGRAATVDRICAIRYFIWNTFAYLASGFSQVFHDQWEASL